ncbi:MAG: hypothetical protein HYX74_03750 [Acidobacteria bacterium]|nr:hypothetical protein [Acidobacteriota bacterium]
MAHRITPTEVKKARDEFEANEPRDRFYRAATELVDLALRRATSLTVAEALAVLLQTWNKAYYQYRPFDNAHFTSIERLLSAHHTTLTAYRNRSIAAVALEERAAITKLFQAGSNGDRYRTFISISQRQCEDLTRADPGCQNPMKRIDEYNYCKYTKRW